MKGSSNLSLLDLLLNRKVLNAQLQSKYDAYTAKLEKCLNGGAEPMVTDENNTASDEVGIPENLRVRRRYTMSEAALEQRRNATK
ncbi:MAG: hypothetical protein NT010_07785 [Proteobacteria bacterium]|nr:hypothetical protein [Pseudomonadota bacterium]